MTYKEIKKWEKERNTVLLTHDTDKFREFYNKWYQKGIYQLRLPTSDIIVRASMEKAIIGITKFSEEEKEKAKGWLILNGFTTDFIGGKNETKRISDS